MENTPVENQEVDTTVTEEVETETVETEKIESTNEDLNKIQENLDKREKELFQREVKSSLKDKGLEAFEEIINVDSHEDLDAVMAKLTKIMNDLKIEQSYQPKDNTKQDSYTVAKQNGDSRNMIKALFGNR
ncbi:hypothetical protein [Planococcus sp. S3-L1]|uniref:hypothetical protein n=1 Tax=Planococcus sp. S3-L1 TaxID=3046200 RepID=UPI0024BAB7C2|nr:hypothetical protein [Planococcus sp. S3-L1]MDJ0331728.1 hypothetical protein [Planococcus sp. S3-L1]